MREKLGSIIHIDSFPWNFSDHLKYTVYMRCDGQHYAFTVQTSIWTHEAWNVIAFDNKTWQWHLETKHKNTLCKTFYKKSSSRMYLDIVAVYYWYMSTCNLVIKFKATNKKIKPEKTDLLSFFVFTGCWFWYTFDISLYFCEHLI